MPALKQKQEERLYTEEDYYALPDGERAELIHGVFYDMASPGRVHQEIQMQLSASIYNYIQSKGGPCKVYPAPFAVRLFCDKTTFVEPDISVICDPSKLTEKGCDGAPDWVIEIASPSNPEHDFLTKLNLYKQAGVKEYWIVNPMEQTVLVYCLIDGEFGIKTYPFGEKIKAGLFEELWLTV